MSAVLWLALSLARADDHHVVRQGDTIEAIATRLAPALGLDPAAVAADLRAKNGLAGDAQPTIGTVLAIPAGQGRDNPATIVAISGTGYAEGGGMPKTALSRGLELPAGATVCTDADSFATIRLAMVSGTAESPVFSHDDASLFPSTCLVVSAAFTRGDLRSSLVSLQQGGLTVRSADETPGTVTIVTPAGVTSGENGGFRVHVEDNAARTEAIDEAVAVFGAGVQVDVAAGEGTRVMEGKEPQAPSALPTQVTLEKPLNGSFLRRPDFYWMPVDRALGYRIEVSVEPDFSEVIAQEDVDVAEWHPEFLLLPFRVPGMWWRVASFDRSGFLGTPSEPRELRFPEGVGP